MESKRGMPGITLTDQGVDFCLWAPFAHSVAVMGDFNDWNEAGIPLEGRDGYWYGSVKGAKVGQEYKYLIRRDGYVAVKNDPRALQLSTTKNSVIVSPTFDWGDDVYIPPAIEEQVIYEMHIGTFHRPDPAMTGTFASAMEKLDHLVQLGVTTIELMPCNESTIDRWWGYTPDFIYAVESAYGGRRAFMEFVKAAHQRNIGVMLDVVYNHLNYLPLTELWRFDGWYEDEGGGIYFYNDWRRNTPWGATRLDYGRPEVRSYIHDNVMMWLRDCHIDGLRVDATNYIRNAEGQDNNPGTDIADGWKVLQDITTSAHRFHPRALLVAEDTSNNPRITQPPSVHGAGFNAQWDLLFPYVIRSLTLTPENDADRNIEALRDAITRTYNDQPFQRVVFSESHDTAANGHNRVDEEIAHGHPSVDSHRRSALAAVLTFTVPGIPLLFQGQEFMEDGAFNHWDALDWSRTESFHGTIQLYTDLIALRRNTRNVSAGLTGRETAILLADNNKKVIAYHRRKNGGPSDDVVIVCNFSKEPLTDLPINFPSDGIWKARFNSDWNGYHQEFSNAPSPDVTVKENGAVTLAPYSAIIYSQDT